ncbi:MAG: hypothetical protein FJY92_11095 [Candidatus Hydrogenedentes bacterium]|nr:hypothetical protein [Candidatus Hydrogenedentota bacterium]
MSGKPPQTNFVKYLSAAFAWHWNLLAFGAGVVFAFLSGHPEMFLPLVAAAEIGYLGMLSTHPRFRKAVDARKYAGRAGGVQNVSTDELLRQMRAGLKPEMWRRFETLRDRCMNLDMLARQFRGEQLKTTSTSSEIQTASLERLLWMFLKLLYSVDALDRFLKGTDRKALAAQQTAGETELKDAQTNKRNENVIRSLQDKVATLHQRLENYDRAAENREFLALELDRIEQKVNAISEMAINSRETSDFSAQVDGITDGIAATEQAMRSLDVGPVLTREDPPPLLQRQEPPPLLSQRGSR